MVMEKKIALHKNGIVLNSLYHSMLKGDMTLKLQQLLHGYFTEKNYRNKAIQYTNKFIRYNANVTIQETLKVLMHLSNLYKTQEEALAVCKFNVRDFYIFPTKIVVLKGFLSTGEEVDAALRFEEFCSLLNSEAKFGIGFETVMDYVGVNPKQEIKSFEGVNLNDVIGREFVFSWKSITELRVKSYRAEPLVGRQAAA
jgi:hypothetical protein